MNIKQALSTFGLTDHEQEVYLLLCKTEWSTILSLSRSSTIKRSTLYRIIDSLITKGLVTVNIEDKRTFYKAADPVNFTSHIIQEEKKIGEMREGMDVLKSHISLLTSANEFKTSVNFYRGERGLSAMEWKIVSYKNSERLIFGNNTWWKRLGNDFAEEIREESIKNNILIRELLNTVPETNYTKFKEYLKLCKARQISREICPIDNEIQITTDAIYLQSINENEVVGIELISKNYAALMRALFETVWKLAR